MSNTFPFRLVKARVAETLIKQLFISCGYQVYDHGMEQALPTITGKLNTNNSPEALQIRQMPDFVVQHILSGQLLYLEVKYRAAGVFKLSDLGPDYHYKQAVFIIVSKKGIFCISYTKLQELGKMPVSAAYRLANSAHFQLDTQQIKAYEVFATQLFSGVE